MLKDLMNLNIIGFLGSILQSNKGQKFNSQNCVGEKERCLRSTMTYENIMDR